MSTRVRYGFHCRYGGIGAYGARVCLAGSLRPPVIESALITAGIVAPAGNLPRLASPVGVKGHRDGLGRAVRSALHNLDAILAKDRR